jgi:transcriptional activator SPT7
MNHLIFIPRMILPWSWIVRVAINERCNIPFQTIGTTLTFHVVPCRNGSIDQHRPRKRTRYTTQYPTPLLDEKDDLSQLWWGAVQSDSLLNNGLPGIPFGPSSSVSGTSSSSKLQQHPSSVKHKRRKPPKQQQQQQPANSKTLLSMMNHNIMTMRRVRHTHAKFAALTASTAPPEDEEQGAEGGGGIYGSGGTGGGTATRAGLPGGIGSSSGLVGNSFGLSEDDGLDDKIDEEPWTVWRGKKGKVKDLSEVEIGEANATDCLHWAGNKILEHVGFQGMLFAFSLKLALSNSFFFFLAATSKVALDVLAAVTSEYLLNVGRTIRFLSDKFGKTMTPEVSTIIL